MAYGKANLPFTGDSNCDYENQLLDRFDLAGATDVFSAHVLKVTHHGSQNGTGRRFGARVNPGLAFASTNEDGDHRWENVSRNRLPEGCLMLETWERGDIVIETNGGAYRGGVLFRVRTGQERLREFLGLDRLRDRRAYPRTEQTSRSQNRACG